MWFKCPLFTIVMRNNHCWKERAVLLQQWKLAACFWSWVSMLPLESLLKTKLPSVSTKWDILGALGHAVVWSGLFYLVVVYQVENQVYVSMNRLVLSHLRFHSVQPVNESLESVCKLAREQQGLLKLVLSAGEHKSLTVNDEVFRSTANTPTRSRWRCILTFLLTCHKQCPIYPSVHSACRPASDYHPEGRSCLSGPVLFEWWCRTLSVCCPELFGTPVNRNIAMKKEIYCV